MCGRYWLVTPADVLASRFRVRGERVPLLPRWNAAPGAGPARRPLRRRHGRPRPRAHALGPRAVLGRVRPEDAGRPINARAETAGGKPSFKEPLRRSRALVPADGFFEWKKGDRGREPVAFRLKSRRPFAFAGIFDTWTPRSGPPLRTFAILTTRPNGLVAPVHDRMPLILAPDDEERWLDPGSGPRGPRAKPGAARRRGDGGVSRLAARQHARERRSRPFSTLPVRRSRPRRSPRGPGGATRSLGE